MWVFFFLNRRSNVGKDSASNLGELWEQTQMSGGHQKGTAEGLENG